jgi:hypothetical protein
MKEKYHLIGHILEQIDVNPYLGLQIYEDSKFCTHKGERIDFWLPQAQTHAPEKAQISHTWLKYGQFWDMVLQPTLLDPCHENRNTSSRKNTGRSGARFISNDYRSVDDGCTIKMLSGLSLHEKCR